MQLYNAELTKRIYVRQTPSFLSDNRSETTMLRSIFACHLQTWARLEHLITPDYLSCLLIILLTDQIMTFIQLSYISEDLELRFWLSSCPNREENVTINWHSQSQNTEIYSKPVPLFDWSKLRTMQIKVQTKSHEQVQ